MAETLLNFHHLRYFWAVAKDGNLTRAARSLRVSQSALSTQIKQLEEQLGQALFVREGRGLELTEAGHIALAYAESIFTAGGELLATLKDGRRREHVLRVGAVATLSRNFQESFIKPLLGESGVQLRLLSGSLDELMHHLEAHALDLVLSNRPVQRDAGRPWHCRRIAQQRVSLVGRPRTKAFRFPRDIADVPMLLPGTQSELRATFDALCEQLGVRVRVLAEVDDMAMMRLLARDTQAVALLPSVVVRDELRGGVLQEYCVVPGLHESFYAITVE
ncbi:MAG TPA: LysR family transcriptional regulator, partial [Myxococcaceae bacterium]|nr:LysR family transcriptional regulator [Myxococcaceae bacterium]